MANFGRDIRDYRLVYVYDVEEYNGTVTQLIRDGFQFWDGGVRTTSEPDGGMVFMTEMVRYAPELRGDTGIPTTRRGEDAENFGSVEALHRRATQLMNERVMRDDDVEATPERNEVPEPPPRPFWTADSLDPFEDDEEQDDDEMNDHQLNRLGALRQEFDDEMDVVTEGPRPANEIRTFTAVQEMVRNMDRNRGQTEEVPF